MSLTSSLAQPVSGAGSGAGPGAVSPGELRPPLLVRWSPTLRVLAPILHIAFLGVFLLPWITVSHRGRETEQLSGIELVSGRDPVIRGAVPSGSRLQNDPDADIREAVGAARVSARLNLVASVVAVLASAIGSASLSRAFGRLVLAGAVVTLTAALAVGLVGGLFGPSAHPLVGFYVGVGASLAIVTVDFLLTRVMWLAADRRFDSWPLWPALLALPFMLVGGTLLWPLGALLFVLGLGLIIGGKPTWWSIILTLSGIPAAGVTLAWGMA
ncbi:MAG: hypothetical protein HY875_11050 [Chloroflexi bacterium]|nr:hypothetical protein [Chloroflexota bacterium]